jgi:superfamily II DNA or RNA helicase
MRQLGTFFEGLAYEYALSQAVADGFLCPIRALTLPIKIDLTGIKPANGDWSKDQVASALDPYIPELCRGFAENAMDRKGLIFVPLCATGKKVQAALFEHGMRAYYCSGEDRSQIKPWENDGAGSVMVNSMLLTEGYDHPPVSALAVWRFTKSQPFYQQMVGRGTRISEGKTDLRLIDNLFLSERHQLCRPAHLICEDDEIADKLTEIAERDTGRAMDLTDAEIEKARQEVIQDREAALAKKLAEMRHRKRDLVDPLQYAMSIGRTELVDYKPALGSEVMQPTQTQVDALAKCGIFPSDINSSGHADALLATIAQRKELGLAQPKQIRILERYDFTDVGKMTAERAQKLIGRIAANGWRRPPKM